MRVSCDPAFAGEPRARRKLEHYVESLTMVEQVLGSHPLVAQLRFELEALRQLPPRDAPVPA